MSDDPRTGDQRCWPCTVANATVGLLVAWIPLAGALLRGDPALVGATLAWGLLVSGFTGYRLYRMGYLPLAEPVAKFTGLHDRIGPGSESDADRPEDN